MTAGTVTATLRLGTRGSELARTQSQAVDLGCKQPIPPNPDCATQAQLGVKTSLALGQPPYLANLLIETNRGLQQFQGQPPGQTPNAHFHGNGVPRNYQFFSPISPNMSFSHSPYNMGGCMGCHGVAHGGPDHTSRVVRDRSGGAEGSARPELSRPTHLDDPPASPSRRIAHA
jgi:hypothetical protein